MLVADFDYDLPKELIAQTPAEPRDSARLMVFDRKLGIHEHRLFGELDQVLDSSNVLVLNDTRVEPRRLLGHKTETGGQVELLLLDRLDEFCWNCMVHPGLKESQQVVFRLDGKKVILEAVVISINEDGTRCVRFDQPVEQVWDSLGILPIPPYIKEFEGDEQLYQTTYAQQDGSVAAPTAGRHFTAELIARLEDRGIQMEKITLHVSRDTAFPIIKQERVEDVRVHSEFVNVSTEVAQRLNQAKKDGKQIIAVGTTTVRTLEAIASTVYEDTGEMKLKAWNAPMDLFISPGYDFKFIDGLITNFHFPRSSLIMLVAAFLGRERLMELYHDAIERRYRFFSFGDAMLLS